MPFTIIRNDITKLSLDAIVNAANTQLRMGGGVCGAIFNAAGADMLQSACDSLAPIKTGEAAVTQGFNLPAKYIIHTAGPVYRDGNQGEEALLRSCYINSLNLAVKHNCESIAFPLISSGIYAYPKAEALRVATNAIRDYINDVDIDVFLVLFDKETLTISEELLGAIESYIDEHYVKEKQRHYARESAQAAKERPFSEETMLTRSAPMMPPMPRFEEASHMPKAVFEAASYRPPAMPSISKNLDQLVGNLDEPFSATLLRLIDASGRKDSDIYRRANIDRRLFSKIRSNEYYSPSKPTVLALAIALELTLKQTTDLLERAGFAFSRSRKFDVIVEFFIQSRKYDIFEINEVLFSYDQPLLGG